MPAGFGLFGDSGESVLNGDDLHWHLIERRALNIATDFTRNGSAWYYNLRANTNLSNQLVALRATAAYAACIRGPDVGGQSQHMIVTDRGSGTIDAFVFASNPPAGGAGIGIQLFNSSGELSYSSSNLPLTVLGKYSTGVPEYSGYVGKPLAGKSIALVHSKVEYAIFHHPTANLATEQVVVLRSPSGRIEAALLSNEFSNAPHRVTIGSHGQEAMVVDVTSAY